ncbi:DNA repair protein RadA [Deferribacterales bacterium Es71-Z0220]|uniref:DNA repair protein RadA n=1 Tax=Deferrivibrio essentukiensis TaxID=2880922 RepID=UPI001F60C9BD|nr:DNA repair protein RadA [Deferrivibrio essentukiensis]MCB4203756.1 DNA repair protein RadA [Deferrivibrio essentukiensis]
MVKKKTNYICQSCGAVAPKWTGKCPECGAWNSFVEEVIEDVTTKKAYSFENRPILLSEIRGLEVDRTTSGINEFDQVLGGGIVKGSVVLIGGEPGIGKSTIMLQIASKLSDLQKSVLYLSGEESASQIKLRAERLKVNSSNVSILSTTNINDLFGNLEENIFDFIFIDSIQTVYSKDLNSSAGTVGQIRYVTQLLVELAKSRGITVFLVGQVTKDGAIAGPKVLEHLVDTVLYFEGDYTRGIRILRAVKNRFGSTNEVGLFEMKSEGLKEITTLAFINSSETAPGRAMAVTLEGTRPIVIEIQSLVSNTYFNFSKRNVNGMDLNRLHMLIAILEKKVGANLGQTDVFVNIAGGLKINEPGADMAVVAAIMSSFREISLPLNVAFIGEVGLTGELRSVSSMNFRINECKKMGISKVYLPADYDDSVEGIEIVKFKKVDEFLNYIF